jgi:hypothetical protein
MAIRICFNFEGDEGVPLSMINKSYQVDDFPAVPRKGDLLNLDLIIGNKALDFEEHKYLSETDLRIDFIAWSRDSEGIYLNVWLKEHNPDGK